MGLIETDTTTAPAYWACLLINGDGSGMEDPDEKAANDWAESLLPWYVVGIDDENEGGGFLRYHDAAQFSPYAADCAVYILHKIEESK
jgi:hypothetical protein